MQRKWNFSLGTVFSLIVVYFIFLYSRDRGWALLAFLSKWYLIITGGLIALSLAIVTLVMLFSLIMFLAAFVRLRSFTKKAGKKKEPSYVDVDYEVRE